MSIYQGIEYEFQREAERNKKLEEELRSRYRSQRTEKAMIWMSKSINPDVVVKLDENAAAVHASMAKEIPKQVIIQTSQKNNRYLHFYKEHPVLPNALQFAGDYSFELETRFEVEPATTGTGLVHIRSLQNNKYWKKFGTGKVCRVSAMAEKPEENQSDEHCTLFQPIFVYSNNNRVLRLRHVHTVLFVTFFHSEDSDDLGLLSLQQPGKDLGYDVCTFIDWESVVVLPNLVRFKRYDGKPIDKKDLIRSKAENKVQSEEDRYLKASEDGFMDFQSNADNSSRFDFEVHPSRDGGVRLRSVYYNKYWTEMETIDIWVYLKNADPIVHETNTVFLPTIVVGNRIMLRCLKNDMFCQINTASPDGVSNVPKKDCLAAFAAYPHDNMSYMEIVEPVDTRSVDNVRYYFKEARRYNEKRLALVTDDVSNGTKGSLTSDLILKVEITDKYTWNTGTQFKLGGKMKFTAGIPGAYSVGIEATKMISDDTDFGEVKETKKVMESEKSLVVKPMTRVKATWMGTRLSYDVPFSYTQHDKLLNGGSKDYTKYDGILTCHDGYDYKYEDHLLPLEPLPLE